MADALTSFREGLKAVAAEQYQEMREAVSGLDSDALNWRPGPETNSIAVLVIHSLGAEESCVMTALNDPGPRDRDAELQAVASTPEELIAEIDRVAGLMPGLLDRVTAEDLEEDRTRPDDRLGRVRPGVWWLLQGVRHSREHLGQMFLTRQLYEQQLPGRKENPAD